MGHFLEFIFWLWFIVSLCSAPFFWAKKVDRSLAPIVRRLFAIGYGFAWPYFLVNHFTRRRQLEQRSSEQDRVRRDILDD